MTSSKDYKGQKFKVIMMGTKQKIAGWQGELCVAVIQYGPSKEEMKYDVVADSTHPGDEDDLPEVKTFNDQNAAMAHFWKLERNKDKWKV